jgi:hypothetical protein
MKTKAMLATSMFLAAACGGGGGGDDNSPPIPRSGEVDVSYGTAGKVSFVAADGIAGAVVDGGGNAYVTGSVIVKVDSLGRRVSGYGGVASPPESYPVLDGAGNLFTITLNAGDPLQSGDVVKRNLAGQPDTSFGGIPVDLAPPGRVHIVAWPGIATVEALHRDAVGNLLVVGSTVALPRGPVPGSNTVMISKVDASGRPVYSFGDNATKKTAVQLDFFPAALASTLDVQGNFVVAGRDPLDRLLVAKLDPQGEPVAAFGQAGTWIAPFCGATEDDVTVAIDSAGGIYAAVSCEGAATIFKLDEQGRLVGTFGSAGRAAGFFPAGGTVGALLPSRDGGLYVGGVIPAGTGSQLAVAKLSPNGVSVTGFGTNGLALPGAAGGPVNLLALDAAGMLYVGGSSYVIFRLGG